MEPSVYELFKILKFMIYQYNKGEKISKLTLITFCEKMLTTLQSSITYAAMYESCYKNKETSKDRRDFHQLSREIDDKIMKILDQDIRFEKYDKRMADIMGSRHSKYRTLCLKYSALTCDIFNLNNIEKPKIPKNKISILQKFDISNLVV